MAISCEPSELMAAARCLRCLPDPVLRAARARALAVYAGVGTDPAMLAYSSRQYRGLNSAAVSALLLAYTLYPDTDQSEILNSARCFDCVAGDGLAEQVYALQSLNGETTDQNELGALVRCWLCYDGALGEMEIYALTVISGYTGNINAGSACWACLPAGLLNYLFTYLTCGIAESPPCTPILDEAGNPILDEAGNVICQEDL